MKEGGLRGKKRVPPWGNKVLAKRKGGVSRKEKTTEHRHRKLTIKQGDPDQTLLSIPGRKKT